MVKPMDSAPPLDQAPAALVFDLDGTLVDTVETRIRAWLDVFEEFEIPATHEQVAPLIGIDGKRLAREVAAAADRPLDAGQDEEVDRRCGAIYEELNRDPRPLPGARELLNWLDDTSWRWAIATSSRREQVGTSLAALDLGRDPTIVDGSSVEHAKPAPDLLLAAAEALQRDPPDCWCIGDSTWDMRAAAAAGMPAVGVTAGAAVPASALRETGARLVTGTLMELQAELHRRRGESV
jgi:HAD superfamily hydrolase (TIGR01509 family)